MTKKELEHYNWVPVKGTKWAKFFTAGEKSAVITGRFRHGIMSVKIAGDRYRVYDVAMLPQIEKLIRRLQ